MNEAWYDVNTGDITFLMDEHISPIDEGDLKFDRQEVSKTSLPVEESTQAEQSKRTDSKFLKKIFRSMMMTMFPLSEMEMGMIVKWWVPNQADDLTQFPVKLLPVLYHSPTKDLSLDALEMFSK